MAAPLAGLAQVATPLTTFTNPMPAASDSFGYSVAAVGSNRFLIGAPYNDTSVTDAGAAYLFKANGTLLTAFTNPNLTAGGLFGASVAAVGNDRVLVGVPNDNTGATDAGAAYLFGTNGTLLATFTNPTPAAYESFGFSLAAVGNDRVLISASYSTVAAYAGAAYLFSTNGTLLTTFTNPVPSSYEFFGWSVTAVGNDCVLVGTPFDANVGSAYLFRTNGTLLTTFTNPTPAPDDRFGWSVAAMGSDRVLIGAIKDDTGARDSGAAYLFSTNGVLLTTFTNPTPQDSAYFGRAVAAVGNDHVLIGAQNAGAAYLFTTNGTLPTAFTNPPPVSGTTFGWSVAAAGGNRVLIGSLCGERAYLFSIPPLLEIGRDGSGGFFVRYTGAPDVTCRLQRAASVTGTGTDLATNTAPVSGLIEFRDVSPLPGPAFYRTVQP